MVEISESLEQQKIIQWLKIKKIFHFSIPNGAFLKGNRVQRAMQINKLKAEGFVSGASDIVVMLNDVILFIELKRSKKVLKSGKLSTSNSNVSKEQIAFIDNVNKFNYSKSRVCYGFDDCIEFIKSNL